MLRKRLFSNIIIISAVLCLNGIVYAASSKKNQSSANKSKSSSVEQSSKGVSIPVPDSAKKSQAYFATVAPRILNLICDGSPRSLKLATSLLHRNSEESYTEKEKVLLFVCQGIMQMAWPSQPVTWTVPEFSGTDAYTNSIYSARSGMFEIKVKNQDYLSLMLPSLVVLATPYDSDCYDKAEASLSKALSINDKSTLVNYLMGVLMYRKGDFKESFTYLSKALELDGSNKEILALSVKVCNSCGDYENAMRLGERLVSLDPQNIDNLKLVCDSYYATGNLEKAGDYAAKILMLAPDSFDYVLMRAKIAMSTGDFVKTSSLLDAYSRSGSVSKDYYLLRARLQKEWNKNNNSAAETVGNALLVYPDDTDIILYAAIIASDANMNIAGFSALELAKKVLKVQGNNREAVRVCVSELNKTGEYSKAYELSSKIVQKNSSVEDLCRHIDICLSSGKSEEAFSVAKSLYAKNKQNVEVQKSFVKVLVAANQTSEAEKMISSLMVDADSEMKSFLYYQKSFLYGDEASTLESLRSSLTQNPRNSESLYRLYQVYYNKKDWRRAQYYLRQVVALNPIDANALAKNEELNTLLQK